MKKFFAIVAIVAMGLLALCCTPKTNADFLRIHVRADSNSDSDQAVKYLVRDAVVAYLSPYLADAHTKAEAMSVVKSHLADIKAACDDTLRQNGKSYQATVRLCQEEFPTRSYAGVTLDAGIYDALIIELGSGSGNNWWCVVYPPLCFVGETDGTTNIRYRSKLLEIIREWQSSH